VWFAHDAFSLLHRPILSSLCLPPIAKEKAVGDEKRFHHARNFSFPFFLPCFKLVQRARERRRKIRVKMTRCTKQTRKGEKKRERERESGIVYTTFALVSPE
jgi:hypothetical protein